MDPLSILGAIIAIAQVAQAIQASIGQVQGNKKRLEGLAQDIIRSLDDLERFSKAHVDEVDESEHLRAAILKLQCDMSCLLARCQKLVPRSNGSHLSKVKASVKAWQKKEQIAEEMSGIKDLISFCYTQFTAFTAARVEMASCRMEKSIVVRGVEHKAHLQRLEVLMTNMFLDTRFGKQVIQQVGRTIANDPGDRSIEHSYLFLQINKALDTMEAHPSYRGPISEIPDEDFPVSFDPRYTASLPEDFVVTDLLILSRKVQTSGSCITVYSVARDFELVAGQLNSLGLYKQAISIQKVVVQLLRNLVSGGCHLFLPYLAHSLKNLSIHFQNEGCDEEGVIASEDSLVAFRLICDTFPELDFRPLLAMSLKTHGAALSLAGRDTEAVVFLAESSTTYAELIQETHIGTRSSTFSLLFPACEVHLLYSTSLRLQYQRVEAYEALKASLSYLSLISRQDLDEHNLWHLPSNIFSELGDQLALSHYPIPMIESAVTLYRQLINTDPQRFSPHFLRCLYAHAYLCHANVSKEADTVALGNTERANAFRGIFGQIPTADQPLDFFSFKPATQQLQKMESRIETINEALYAYLSLETEEAPSLLTQNMAELIASFAATFPDTALEAVQRATSNVIVLGGQHQFLLLRILSLLRRASELVEPSVRSRFAPHAQIAMERARTSLYDVDVCKALTLFGYAMVNAGKRSDGAAAIEEAASKYRALIPESSAIRSDFIIFLKDRGIFFQKSGEFTRALECYQEAIELCIQADAESELMQLDTRMAYINCLLQICQYMLAFNMLGSAKSLAMRAHELMVWEWPHSIPPPLYAVLVQCLRLAGRGQDTVSVASKAADSLSEIIESTAEIEERFRRYEYLIHWHALQDGRPRLENVLEKAYALCKEHMGGDISPAALGLRHDTLAVIASHYAHAKRPENVLPFAKAAVETSTKTSVSLRNVAEDIQYFESICDVVAFLWNSERQDDATALLKSVTESWSSSDPKATFFKDQVLPAMTSKLFSATGLSQDELRASLAKHIPDPEDFKTSQPLDDAQAASVSKIMALVGCTAESENPGDDESFPGESSDIETDEVLEPNEDASDPPQGSPPPSYSPPRQDDDRQNPHTPDKDSYETVSVPAAASMPMELEASTVIPSSPTPTLAVVREHPSKHPSWLVSAMNGITVLANFLVIVWTTVILIMFLSRSASLSSLDHPFRLFP